LVVLDVRWTDEFRNWLYRLRDDNAVGRISTRIRRLEHGNPGDVKSLSGGLMEMRIDYAGLSRLLRAAWRIDRRAVVRRRQAHATARHQAGASNGVRVGGLTAMVKTTRVDLAEILDTPERQAAYISAALETGDPAFVRDAIGIVARARGMTEVARATGLNRESLYKALGETGNPEFGTMLGVIRALGLQLAASPIKGKPARQRTRRAA
jgi:probable addiction module antidote protein